LEQSIQTAEDGDGTSYYKHPYQQEIEQYTYPPQVRVHADPIPYLPFESTTATFVEDEKALEEMVEELKKAREIAVDLEHHDYRTYVGIVSLMQISTRDKDWIIDTLKPWRRKLERLNEVFADPKILKVLHGAQSDIIWLQRDLGVYIIGLFDTYHAARALHYQGAGLAFLLYKFVNFNAQKQYQLADWRIRPLPQEMFDYARSDTHFLLHIYDCVRNELISNSTPVHDLLDEVLKRSKEYALQRYEHPAYDVEHGQGPYGWYKMIHRTPSIFSKEQFAVFRAVHQWRDKVSREEDESPVYVMRQHTIMEVARSMPTEKPTLFNVIGSSISPPLRLHIDELLAIIIKAKEQGANGPEMRDIMTEIDSAIYLSKSSSIPNPELAVGAMDTMKTPLDLARSRVTSVTPTGTVPHASASLTAEKSSFWGKITGWWQQRRNVATEPRLVLPLPSLTTGIFEDADDESLMGTPFDGPTTPTAIPVSTSTPPTQHQQTNDLFVIRQPGRPGNSKKRKAAETDPDEGHRVPLPSSLTDGDTVQTVTADEDDEMAGQKDEMSIHEHRESKRQRKARRKIERNMEREERGRRLAEETARMEAEDPFDYTTAPSVLHAERKVGENLYNVLDPFKEASNAPKGLSRKQKEKAGKSQTWT
jgi:exosome complex exonuclease RRP6